jgi:hypothetical protein
MIHWPIKWERPGGWWGLLNDENVKIVLTLGQFLKTMHNRTLKLPIMRHQILKEINILHSEGNKLFVTWKDI